MDFIDKSDILNKILDEKQLLHNDAEKYEKYNELQEIVEQIDLSVLETNEDENITPSTSKRRKTSSRIGSENNDSQLDKHEKELEETLKQIKLVKKALAIIYEMESTSFKKFVSKYGVKHRNVVSRVPFIKRIKDNGKAIPLWIGREDETPPELCGAIQADKNYVAEIGDIVAALVINDKKENWILAEVVAYDPNRKEYKVDDIYEEPKKEQTISWKKVIPLPKMRADPETNPDALFPKDALVLALFPGTTCFYPAVVGELPTKPQDPYKLLFEDSSYESGFSSPISVHQRYVIRYEDSSEIKGKTEETRK